MNMSPSVQDHLQRLLKTAAVVILAGLIFALCSCKSNDQQYITTKVSRSVPGAFGAGIGAETTTTTVPYESPAYTGGVMQLFAR